MDKDNLVEQRELEENCVNLKGNGRFRITFPTTRTKLQPKQDTYHGAVGSQPIMAHSNVSFR